MSVTAGTDTATINLLEGTNGGAKSVVDSVNIKAGNDIDVTVSGDDITISHETISTTFIPDGAPDTVTATEVDFGGEIPLVSLAEVDNGHVTKLEFKKYKLPTLPEFPEDNDTTYDLTTTENNSSAKLNLVAGGSGNGTDTVTISGSNDIKVTSDNNLNITVTHETPTNGTDVTKKTGGSLGANQTFNAVKSLKTNSTGHITEVELIEYSMPAPEEVSIPNMFQTFKVGDVTLTPEIALDTLNITSSNQITVTGTEDSDTITIGHSNSGVAAGTYGSEVYVPKITVDAQGHITSVENITITQPTVNDGVLTLKAGSKSTTFSANQSTNTEFEITASDLGLGKVIQYIGKTTTELSDGSTTQSIQINEETITVKRGDVVIDSNDKKEYIWNGSNWEEFGNEGNYKVKQDSVSDPTKNGETTLDFIATITQDENGVISPIKKTVPTASTDLGVVKTTSTVTSTDGLTASPIIDGVVYYKNTAHTHTAGTGLSITGNGGVDGNVEYSLTDTGVTAGTYGEDGENRTLGHGGTFNIPYYEVDAQGRLKSSSTKTLTLPGDNDTTYTFENGSAGSFDVTPLNGTKQNVTVDAEHEVIDSYSRTTSNVVAKTDTIVGAIEKLDEAWDAWDWEILS